MPVFRPVIFAALSVLTLLPAGCSELPRGDDVIAQADQHGEIAFNVVKVDDSVVDVLAARPRPAFRERFKEYLPAPELKIGVGDVVSVVIWEAAANGLFGNSLALPGLEALPSATAAASPGLRERGAAGISEPAAHAAPPGHRDPRSARRPRWDDHDSVCRADRRRGPDHDRAGAPDRGSARPNCNRPAGAGRRAARLRQRGHRCRRGDPRRTRSALSRRHAPVGRDRGGRRRQHASA